MSKIPPEAFEYYVSLGPSRSYQAVADHYDVTKRAVVKFAGREGWTDRLHSIQMESREKGDQRIVESLEEMRKRHLMTLKVMNARVVTALKQYPLSSAMEAMRAAEMVIKLERLIVGDPGERTAMSVEEVTRRELDQWLDESDEAEAATE